MDRQESWHLSKSVPITFIAAIMMQTVALIWFVATLRNDVNVNRMGITRNEGKIESLETIVHSQAVTLGRIDENIKSIRELIERREQNGQ